MSACSDAVREMEDVFDTYIITINELEITTENIFRPRIKERREIKQRIEGQAFNVLNKVLNVTRDCKNYKGEHIRFDSPEYDVYNRLEWVDFNVKGVSLVNSVHNSAISGEAGWIRNIIETHFVNESDDQEAKNVILSEWNKRNPRK